MAEDAIPPRTPRPFHWIVLIGIPLGGVLVYCLCVPFMSWTLSIDRRTGAFQVDVCYFGIPVERNRPVVNSRGHPVGKGPLTAPPRAVPVLRRSQRFFWSTFQAKHHDKDGVWLAEAYYQLFCFADGSAPGARRLSNDEVDRIVRQRIPFWNSKDLDLDPRAVAEAAKQENSELLGVPVGYRVIE